jgi:prolyl 4-hydroxylase
MKSYHFIGIILITLFIIVLSISIKQTIDEGFGYDNDPSQFREPKVYPNFITKDEAKHILKKAEYNYKDSVVVGIENPEGIRKSQTYWLDKDDPIAHKIIQKVCDLDGHTIEQSEDIQVVKYEPNGYYNEHHDSCCDDDAKCNEFVKDGNRVLTMVIYLNDDFEGGATRFPKLDKNFKPKKYSGILFYPMNKNGDKCHEKSLHAGTPVTKGVKYIANVWIREKLVN